jgi:hypothetical protein
LLHIRGIYINQNKLEQKTTLLSLIVKVGSSWKFFLLDGLKKKHFVCKNMFCSVYQLSSGHLSAKLKKWQVQSQLATKKEKRGTYKRKNEQKIMELQSWIQNQKKHFSHFTRRLDQKTKWIFSDYDSFNQLYHGYKRSMMVNNRNWYRKTRFYFYFKKFGKQYTFKKSKLDICPICLKFQGLDQRMKARKMSKEKIEEGNFS